MLSDEIRAALFARRDLKARRRGDQVQFCCPRHEDRNPSAWMKDGSWGCFSCGFTEPLQTLAETLGVPLKGAGRGYTLEDYADEKAFPAGALRAFGLETVEERGRAVLRIPYHDADGTVLRSRFRSGPDKWWEGRNRPIYLYGLNRLADVRDGQTVLVVEGESDCHAAWVEGFAAVGVPGATTWKSEWAHHLKGLDIVVWEEPDQGGPQLVASIARDFPAARVIQDPPAKDLADLRKQHGARFGDVLRGLIAQAPRIGTPKPPVVFDALLGPRLEALLADKLRPVDAVATPFPMWNQCCADDGGRVGLARGWHVVGAAKTGAGKSILALNIAAAAVRAGERVCFVSLEMSQNEVDTRMLGILADKRVRALEKGRDFDRAIFREAARRVAEIHEETGGAFWTNREPVNSLQAVTDSIVFNHEVHGCRLFVVDYLQLAGNPMDPETIVAVSHAVRSLAKKLHVITLGLSQFNRTTSASKERPTKEGLLGGSPLEQDADQVVLIDHSRITEAPPPAEGWHTYLLLDKNRHGPLADIPYHFDTRTLRLRELLPDEMPAQEREERAA